jgi:RNA methyltransferase, TrmH family
MFNNDKITSLQNPKIKNLKRLEKAAERKEQNLFLIEGLREIVLAHRAGYEIVELFICDEILKQDSHYPLSELQHAIKEPDVTEVSQAVYNSVAYRETTEGIIATATMKELTLDNLQLPENPLVLVVEDVEKPGNLGAMLRTADAAGVDAVIICDNKTDIYNPNVIRSSIGTVFTNHLATCESDEAIQFLKKQGIATYAADLAAADYHYQQNFKKPTAIVVGAEATGLSRRWKRAADANIKIPMMGKIDSLNVSVSAAVLLFEARRQRMN